LQVVCEDCLDDSQKTERRRYPIILSYADKWPPFLFTGLLTLRRTVVDDNFGVLFDVTRAIMKSINALQRETVADKYIKFLTEKFGREIAPKAATLGVSPADFVRIALHRIQTLHLFPTNITPNESAFQKAGESWREIRGGSAIEGKTYIEKSPSIFLSPGWLERPELQDTVIDHMDESALVTHNKIQGLIKRHQQNRHELQNSHPNYFFFLACSAYLPYVLFGVCNFVDKVHPSLNGVWVNTFQYSVALLSLMAMLLVGGLLFRAWRHRNYMLRWRSIFFVLTFSIGTYFYALNNLP